MFLMRVMAALSSARYRALNDGAPSDVVIDPRSKRLQAALKIEGFYTGSIDGAIGPASRRAQHQTRQAGRCPTTTAAK